MKICLSEGMKRVKELNERKSVILIDELRRMQVSYKEGEQPVQVDYDYAKTREEVKSIDDEVRKIRHLTALANCTAMTDEGCTISEALVLLAQLNAEKARVERLAAAEKLTRRITPNGVLEYTVCNYEPAAAAADCAELRSRIYRLQLAIDRANLNTFIEV